MPEQGVAARLQILTAGAYAAGRSGRYAGRLRRRGSAAPQVGVLRRVCVVLDEEDQLIELVNPEIIYTEGEQTGLEGCLSVPGKYGVVTRPEVVRVRAQDRDGQWFEVEDEGLTARCFCHEIEHLDGHLFVEHTDRLMEGEELQKWLEAHADEYEIEEEEDK